MTLISPYVHKPNNPWGKLFLMIVSILLMDVSCASYVLHETQVKEPFPVDQSKNVVLHQGNRFVKLKSFEMHESELKGFPTGQLQADGELAEKTTSGQVAQEVHLYLDETTPLVVEPGSPIVVPFSSINKVMVYDEEAKKGCIVYLKAVGAVVLVVLLVAVQVGIMVLQVMFW
jgi:hypothetical protein